MIEIKDLSINMNGETLISGLNARLNTGEFWAVLGKNGTGKTTLLHTMAGFLKYQYGSIQINNNELKSLNVLVRAQNISFLPQIFEASLNCTVRQSIAYGRYPWYKSKFLQEQETKAVNDAITAMELNDIQHKSIQQISGGELRKVEIATILAQDSEVMMLDEPLNHLDLSFRFKLMKLLQQLSKNKTVIVVTHDIQYVKEYCSHVIMLFENKQSLIGKVDELMTSDNLNKMLGLSLPERFIN
ncbi:MAG TPA: ABC transporter ATP-binding protein [Oceanospirillales bacterium]|nr:ABC transporter ATP-binding protein [Oceanospirillales bacterium]